MVIKISPITPVKKELDQADPSGETYVMIKPITYRDDMARGELLKERETSNTGRASKGINMYFLRAEELWLTYADAHIVLEDEDGKQSEPFGPREEMTRDDFMKALIALQPAIVFEWHQKIVEVNPDWAFPF